jgi:predicted DNA-binding protein
MNKKNKDEKKEASISIRMSYAMYKKLGALAHSLNITRGEVIRRGLKMMGLQEGKRAD